MRSGVVLVGLAPVTMLVSCPLFTSLDGYATSADSSADAQVPPVDDQPDATEPDATEPDAAGGPSNVVHATAPGGERRRRTVGRSRSVLRTPSRRPRTP
ncbi:MAG: hypothetical protein BGO98_39550 [Myxococcales bacterium 68-20]|nr:MAG: hypothetical protein BGO98_39550 [Myxococcales bacterium 68-20]